MVVRAEQYLTQGLYAQSFTDVMTPWKDHIIVKVKIYLLLLLLFLIAILGELIGCTVEEPTQPVCGKEEELPCVQQCHSPGCSSTMKK